jgi:Trk-type K+ transport system membrane component
VLAEFDRLNDALVVAVWVILSYILFFLVVGITTLIGALSLRPNEPELEARHFTSPANAAFLAVSQFTNAGFTISSSSVGYLKDDPLAYFIGSMLILAGNSMLAVYLRVTIVSVKAVRQRLGWDTAAYQYILDYPRRITTHLFSHEQTQYFAAAVLALNVVQYVFCLGSSVDR